MTEHAELRNHADLFTNKPLYNFTNATGLKVKDAKDFFANYQRDLVPDYTNLIRLFRKRRIDEPIPNSNYIHGLGLIAGMFSETRQTLRMLTGNSCEAVPELLFGSFEELLGRLKRSGGAARVIVIDGECSELTPLLNRYPDTLQVAFGEMTEGSRLGHFIVCDDDMVREEEYHERLSNESPADMVKASVYCANRGRAKAAAKSFDGIWDKLTAV